MSLRKELFLIKIRVFEKYWALEKENNYTISFRVLKMWQIEANNLCKLY